jgi:hypothetical protein
MDENIIFVCSSRESSIVLISRKDEFLIKDIYMFKKDRKDKKSKAGKKRKWTRRMYSRLVGAGTWNDALTHLRVVVV